MSSRIDPGITIEGSVRGEGELVVAGRLRGALVLQGTLVVEEGGVVEAEVEATSVVVAGTLSGSVTAHEEMRIQPGGYVDARVRASRLAAAEGAIFRGELQAFNGAPGQVVHAAASRERVASPTNLPSPPRVVETAGVAPTLPVPTVSSTKKRAFATPETATIAAPAAKAAVADGAHRMPALPKGRTTFQTR